MLLPFAIDDRRQMNVHRYRHRSPFSFLFFLSIEEWRMKRRHVDEWRFSEEIFSNTREKEKKERHGGRGKWVIQVSSDRLRQLVACLTYFGKRTQKTDDAILPSFSYFTSSTEVWTLTHKSMSQIWYARAFSNVSWCTLLLLLSVTPQSEKGESE